MSEQLSGYGGNARVAVATSEIHRVLWQLEAVERVLCRMVAEAAAALALNPSPQTLALAAGLPIWIARVRYLQFCCWVSKQHYFTAEARVRNLMHLLLPGATSTAAAALGAGATRLSPAQVKVTAVGAIGRAPAPSSLRMLLNRLEATAKLADGTIRIESWSAGGRNHYLIYLPGTQDWSPIAGSNPLNLTSDLQAIAAGRSDSQTAVMAALKAAGARSGDELMFVAHSQGGLVAANVAQHPAGFNVSAIFAIAAPLAGITALKKTSVLALEHSNDPVPYLAGKANPIAKNFVTVQSTAPISGVAAHLLSGYGSLATTLDRSGEGAAAKARRRLLSRIPVGKRLKVQLIKVERKPTD